MHVLFADSLDASAEAALEASGHTVTSRPTLKAEDLAAHLEGVDALVVRSTKVIAEAIDAAPQLSLIVRAGAGVENIDMDAASEHGIHVCNVPGRNAVAVAELTMGLLLAIDRHIAAATADLRNGDWNKATYSQADGLLGRTIGIVGLGEIGLHVAERAKAFGMSVIGVRKPNRSDATEARIRSVGVRLVDDLEALVRESDVVSLHVPASDDTKALVDADLLARFRDGAILLNTSRGDCVDEAALLTAMDERGIRAGLDVYQGEPSSGQAEFASPLASHPSVVGTHHVGASTEQAQQSVAAGVAETIEAFAAGDPINCLNLAPRGAGRASITLRHYDRVGVLANVFGVLRGAGLNVQHMENRVFAGGTAAVAIIDVGGEVIQEVADALMDVDNVLGVSVTPAVTR